MTKTKDKLISILSDQLGVDKTDISEEDNFQEDLHMSGSDLTDFYENITKKWPITDINFKKVQTVGDLVDFLELEGEL